MTFCCRAEVYYQTLNIQSLEQSGKFDVIFVANFQENSSTFQLKGLFGSLGGALSLYLGCAVVMLFELAELIIDICIGLLKRRQVANTASNADESATNDSVEKHQKVGYISH